MLRAFVGRDIGPVAAELFHHFVNDNSTQTRIRGLIQAVQRSQTQYPLCINGIGVADQCFNLGHGQFLGARRHRGHDAWPFGRIKFGGMIIGRSHIQPIISPFDHVVKSSFTT